MESLIEMKEMRNICEFCKESMTVFLPSLFCISFFGGWDQSVFGEFFLYIYIKWSGSCNDL